MIIMMVATGDKSRDTAHLRGRAAGPRRVVASRPQNQDPAGAGGQDPSREPVQSTFCSADQVFQTGTEIPKEKLLLFYPFKDQQGNFSGSRHEVWQLLAHGGRHL